MEVSKLFAVRIRELRKSKKLTQRELGELIGSKKSVINNWELRGSIPHASILCQLADYFDVSVDYLLGQTDNPKRNK